MTQHRNVPTPWGKSQGGYQLREGIVLYHCAGHGGAKVTKKLNNQIPVAFRNPKGWYEEDCDRNIVMYFHYDAIRKHMTDTGMQGWSSSAEEYFGRFTKQYFYDYLTTSGYYRAAAIHHFGTLYPPEQLDAYGRERLADELRRIRLLENRRMPQRGDRIRFNQAISFRNGFSSTEFIYQSRNDFCCDQNLLYRIRGWREMEFVILPAAKQT